MEKPIPANWEENFPCILPRINLLHSIHTHTHTHTNKQVFYSPAASLWAFVHAFITYFQPLSSMGTPLLIAHTPHKTEPDCFLSPCSLQHRNWEFFLIPIYPLSLCPTFSFVHSPPAFPLGLCFRSSGEGLLSTVQQCFSFSPSKARMLKTFFWGLKWARHLHQMRLTAGVKRRRGRKSWLWESQTLCSLTVRIVLTNPADSSEELCKQTNIATQTVALR